MTEEGEGYDYDRVHETFRYQYVVDQYYEKYVIDQYYDLEDESNGIHCLDSKYVDPDDLKDGIDSTTNFQN